MDWREVAKWADPAVVVFVIFVTEGLKPLVSRWLKGDAVVVLPLIVGLVVSLSLELSSGQFEWWSLQRRVLLTGFAAAGAYRALRVSGIVKGSGRGDGEFSVGSRG